VSLLLWISLALILVGLFFTAVAAVGLLRLPDLYTRAHATSKADTLGTVLTLAGVALTFGTNVPRAKLVVLAVFLLITNPTATHAITRAAYDQGIDPWEADAPADDRTRSRPENRSHPGPGSPAETDGGERE
jgi:multicomponent Na+:H+ antiporter subunit G